MRARRTKHWSLVAVLATILALGGLVAAPAQALTTRSISTKATPSTAFAGTAVTFTGRVTRSPVGSLVRVQRKSGASWVTVASTRTVTSLGAYKARVVLPTTGASYAFRAVAPATSKLATASSSAVRVTALRQTAISLGSSATSINAGSGVTLFGQVRPYVAGTPITVQRLSSGTWVTAASTVVGAGGVYTRTVSPTETTTYRALVPRTGVNASAASVARTITVTQTPPTPPTITTTSLPDAVTGSAYTATLTKTGGAGTWTKTGTLPAGITLSSAGVLSGTPTAAGTSTFTVTFTETGGLSASKQLSITVVAGPVITTTSLPVAAKNRTYSATLTKAGGSGTWTKTAGSLPAGITLSPDGVLAGTPTVLGASEFTVTFTETATGHTGTKALTLTVAQAPSITTTSLPDATRFQSYTTTLAKTGGAGTWSIQNLPANLTIDASTGVISGTPTAAAGTYGVYPTFTETATGLATTNALALNVVGSNAAITTTSLPDAVRNQAYSATLTHSGGAGTWNVVGLPTGLTYNTGTGAISGTTAVAPGPRSLQVTFTETSTGIQVGKTIPLEVVGGTVVVTTASLPDASRAEPYTVTLTHSGGPGTWAVQGLPAELGFDAGTGVISGVSKTVQQYAVLATFTETSSGEHASRLFSLTVGGLRLAITNSDLPEATRGVPYTVTLSTTGKAGTWNVLGLPDGLSFDAATGVVSGTPTGVAGTYGVYPTFTETITGDTTTRAFALVLQPNPVVTTTELPDATTGTAYSQQLTKTGGAGTWAITKGNLPSGMTLSTAGLLSGTPDLGDDYGFTATFTETASGLADSQALLLHVSNPGAPVITTSSLPDSTVGTPYGATLAATPTGGVWSVSFGNLPPGTSLNSVTGQISGTPDAVGKWFFQVTYTHGLAYQTKVLQITTFPAS